MKRSVGAKSSESADEQFGIGKRGVGHLILWGNVDATVLSQEFAGDFLPRQVKQLWQFKVYAKLMIVGDAIVPFPRSDVAVVKHHHRRRDTLIRRFSEKYVSQRQEVEDKIRRWLDR